MGWLRWATTARITTCTEFAAFDFFYFSPSASVELQS